MSCYACQNNDLFDDLPPRERIAGDDCWRVAHDFTSSLPGWLVLVPRRHVTSIADLTDKEAGTLGIWQVRLSRALRTVTGCVKTYVVQFAEKEGFAHVHFHIVPRMPDLPADRRGPGIFQYPDRGATDSRLPEGQRDDLAVAIRAALAIESS
ncbi:HIT family protein [Actinoplanes sp. NPDC020271]|uniref:HIT family protein n=1 Tax=Actinoplanes sp. NPDC020271 TaxID=3363896 RepID=UPI0037A02E98